MQNTKLKPHTWTHWHDTRLPECNFCDQTAAVDGATTLSSWAYMCRWHFIQYGRGLGLGLGQELVLPGQTPKLQELAQ